MVASLGDAGCAAHRRVDANVWQLDLPASWEEYAARFSKSRRKRLRQFARSISDHELELRIVRRADELTAGIAALTELHTKRREGLGEPSCFESPSFRSFLQEAAPLLLDSGNLQLSLLIGPAGILAVEFSLIDSEAIYLYQSGFDPGSIDLSPGHLITLLLIERAIQDGRRRFDFLRGDEPYKATWGARPRGTARIRVAANRLGPQVRQNVWLAGITMKDWLKNGLHAAGMR